MASFSNTDHNSADYRLLQNGPINLYFRMEIMTEDMNSLRAIGYAVDVFDCTSWKTREDIYDQFSSKLEFPEYFGRNLAALNDCLAYLNIPNNSGRALVFIRFDDFAQREPELSHDILDIIASASWLYVLHGERFFALVQSEDPEIRFDNLGSWSANWNRKEWLNSSRGL